MNDRWIKKDVDQAYIDNVNSQFKVESLLKDRLHEFVPKEKEIEETKQNEQPLPDSDEQPALMSADQVSPGKAETGASSL